MHVFCAGDQANPTIALSIDSSTLGKNTARHERLSSQRAYNVQKYLVDLVLHGSVADRASVNTSKNTTFRAQFHTLGEYDCVTTMRNSVDQDHSMPCDTWRTVGRLGEFQIYLCGYLPQLYPVFIEEISSPGVTCTYEIVWMC